VVGNVVVEETVVVVVKVPKTCHRRLTFEPITSLVHPMTNRHAFIGTNDVTFQYLQPAWTW